MIWRNRDGTIAKTWADAEAEAEAKRAEAETETSLGYLRKVYQGLIKADPDRVKAAIAALAFEFPKLSVQGRVGHRGMATIMEAYHDASARGSKLEMRACAAAFALIDTSLPEAKPPNAAEP